MARRRDPKTAKNKTLRNLTAVAAAFTDRTHIVENAVSAKDEAWRLGFDNGRTILFFADGTYRIARG